jgi:RNA polymerase sigma-32 factor
MAFAGKLKGRDRALFDQRLVNESPATLQELGDQFGISRERTRQLEMRLMARLKNYLRLQLGDALQRPAPDGSDDSDGLDRQDAE